MGDIPIPPHRYVPSGNQPKIQIMDPHIDSLFDDVLPHKEHKDKPKKDKKDGEMKKNSFVETVYEGYTLQRISPHIGDSKSWSKVGMLKLPFDSNKVYLDAVAHKKKTGMGAAKAYDKLGPNQQGIIDRMLAQKKRDEKNPNAVWTLYDVYRVKQETRMDFFRVKEETVKLVVTLRCQDISKSSYADKPPGSTMNASKFVGEIIDLSVPMKDSKKVKAPKDSKRDEQVMNLDDLLDGLDGVPKHDNHHPNPTNDPWLEPLTREDGGWPQSHPDHNSFPHDHHHNGYPPPQVPYPPNMHHNPFMPAVGSPEQYMQPNVQYMPPTLPIDNRAYNEYSARRASRSRSRDPYRPRSRSRPRYYRSHTPSIGSSQDDDGFWSPTYTSADTQFTPPDSPVLGERRRRKRTVYHRENRTLYPDEQVVVVARRRDNGPPVAYNNGRRRQTVVHDDYPQPRRQPAIADYADGYEEAEFASRGRRAQGYDFMTDPFRQEPAYRPSNGARRYSMY